MKKLLIVIFCFSVALMRAQEKKIEKEERIDFREMPASTLFLIKKIPENAKRLRYYYETDGEKESYEAKFKLSSATFSVEFGKAGKLQDIEVTLDAKQLPTTTLKNIQTYLAANHERYNIEKIQAQYLSTATNLESTEDLLLKSLSFKSQKPDNYELIVAVKNNGVLKKFEMLFNETGKFKNERKILRNSYDYLIF